MPLLDLLKYFRTLTPHVPTWYDEFGLDDKQKAGIEENEKHIADVKEMLLERKKEEEAKKE